MLLQLLDIRVDDVQRSLVVVLLKQQLPLEERDLERDLSVAVGARGSELFEVVVCGVDVLPGVLSAELSSSQGATKPMPRLKEVKQDLRMQALLEQNKQF